MKCATEELEKMYANVQSYSGDSGIDLFFPEDVVVPKKAHSFTINLGIKCELIHKNNKNRSYLLLPRSSIGATPLRLANSVGLIDAGYRGDIMVKVDNISNKNYEVKKGQRLFQLTTYNLKRPFLLLKDTLSTTERGEKGFGSTDKKS